MADVKADLVKITCPTLLFFSTDDHVVPPSNVDIIYSGISSEIKEKATLEDSYHVATLDNDQQKIIDLSLQFFETHAK